MAVLPKIIKTVNSRRVMSFLVRVFQEQISYCILKCREPLADREITLSIAAEGIIGDG